MRLIASAALWCFATTTTTTTKQALDFRRISSASTKGYCVRCWVSSTNEDMQEEEEEEEQTNNDLVEKVSDAEALLACQAYLVRKKRFDWKAAAERRDLRQQVQAAALEEPLLGLKSTGFFWEDLSQLTHLYRKEEEQDQSVFANDRLTQRDESSGTAADEEEGSTGGWVLVDDAGIVLSADDDDDDDDSDGDVDVEDIWETALTSPDTARRFCLEVDDEDIEEEADDFSAIDGRPSPSHIRRSEAAKRRWADPEWKARWHEKRWGKRRKRQPCSIERMQERIRRMNPEQFLASPEMASMTKDEIAEAIRTYVQSNRKRVASRKKTLQQHREQIAWDPSVALSREDEVLDRESLLQRKSPEELVEAQRIRSERAKAIYRKRLATLQQQQQQQQPPPFTPSSHSTATTEPLERIESDLDNRQLPAIMDVEAILQRSKLARRKEVLRRILSECFNMRGRCIPGEGDRLLYVTNCSIAVIGAFVLDKLREVQSKED